MLLLLTQIIEKYWFDPQYNTFLLTTVLLFFPSPVLHADIDQQHVVVFNQKHRKSTELDPQYDTFMLTTVFFFRFLCFLFPLFSLFKYL